MLGHEPEPEGNPQLREVVCRWLDGLARDIKGSAWFATAST
jgi:hypothetical protein